MKAYWITRCHVHNSDEYDEYIKLAGPAINKHGGTFLVRGGKQIDLEGGLDNVVQEPDTAYTIHENSSSQPRVLNFSETPDSSAVIYVIHRGIGGYNMAPPAGSVGQTELSNDMKSYTHR